VTAARKIFLTGGGGFIAPHLVAGLPAETSLVINQRTPRHFPIFDERAGVTMIYGNVEDIDFSDAAFDGIDTVMHLAGAVQGMSTASIIDSNLVTTSEILRMMETRSIPHLQFMSTASVWSDTSGQKLHEALEPRPTTLYGHTKLAAERLIERAVEQGRIASAAIFRCNNTYGPGCHQGAVFSFIQQIKAEGRVKIFGDGQQIREPLYVSDLVDLLRKGMTIETGVHTFGVSGPASLTVRQMAEVIAHALGRDLTVELHPEDSDRVRHLSIDIGKLQRELGWVPSVSFEAGIARTVA
jgi:UDP-glucose 4-epimerase